MRINKFVAQATGLSRRSADQAIADGRVTLNSQPAAAGDDAKTSDAVSLDGVPLSAQTEITTILLHKPVGYVVSRNGQGSRTVYELLPQDLQILKPVGRLDKDSSGLLLMTTDGNLAQELTHPSHQKRKVYEVTLDKPLRPLHRQLIAEKGITLEDGVSLLELERQHDGNDTDWIVSMREGRNRQIRRTFQAVGYSVTRLHRTQFGPFNLMRVAAGSWQKL